MRCVTDKHHAVIQYKPISDLRIHLPNPSRFDTDCCKWYALPQELFDEDCTPTVLQSTPTLSIGPQTPE